MVVHERRHPVLGEVDLPARSRRLSSSARVAREFREIAETLTKSRGAQRRDPGSTGLGGPAKAAKIWNEVSSTVRHPRVSVVIPAIDEEQNLPYVAERLPADVDEIVFVNGPSTDGTADAALRLWPDGVHISQSRRGKGNALACGFGAATGDIIVMMDADGSTDPAEIPRYVDALLAGADYAKGSRFTGDGGSDDITLVRQLGNRVLNSTVNALFATKYTDLCYGFNAFWRRCLDAMCLPDVDAVEPQWGDGFEVETLINVRVAACDLNIVEVSSYEWDRIHGVSHLKPMSDGLRVAKTISREFLWVRDILKISRYDTAPVFADRQELAASVSAKSD